MGVKIDKLLESPLYQDHKDALDLPQIDAFSERTGFDLKRDFSSVLGGWNGIRWFAMGRGQFNQTQWETKLASLGAHPREFKSYRLFGDENNSLVFVRKGFVLAGATSAIEELIVTHQKNETGIPAELEQQLQTIPGTDQIWIVSRDGLPFANIPMRSEISSALSNIVGYVSRTAIGVGVDSGLHLRADLTCISDPGAQRVRDALRGGIGLARLTTRDDQLDLLRLYDAIHVDQDKTIIHVRGDFDAELTNKLLASISHVKAQ